MNRQSPRQVDDVSCGMVWSIFRLSTTNLFVVLLHQARPFWSLLWLLVHRSNKIRSQPSSLHTCFCYASPLAKGLRELNVRAEWEAGSTSGGPPVGGIRKWKKRQRLLWNLEGALAFWVWISITSSWGQRWVAMVTRRENLWVIFQSNTGSSYLARGEQPEAMCPKIKNSLNFRIVKYYSSIYFTHICIFKSYTILLNFFK